ncbi:MAG: hypothetical protein RBT65_05150 [Methanolobus sp.]|jgi:uncharacterized membrane protein YqiK|nr:hypothetical protein [Methanolobus sp.]
MDLLTVSLIAVAVFVVFVILTAFFLKHALYMNKEAGKAKFKNGNEDKDNDAAKKDDGN